MAGVGRLLVGGGAVLLGYTITNNALNKVTKAREIYICYILKLVLEFFKIVTHFTKGFGDGQILPPKTGREAAREARRETDLSTSGSSQFERRSRARRRRGRRQPRGCNQRDAAGKPGAEGGDLHLGRL